LNAYINSIQYSIATYTIDGNSQQYYIYNNGTVFDWNWNFVTEGGNAALELYIQNIIAKNSFTEVTVNMNERTYYFTIYASGKVWLYD